MWLDELVQGLDQGLHGGLRPAAENDFTSYASHIDFRALEAKFLGQTHRLAAAMGKQFGFWRGRCGHGPDSTFRRLGKDCHELRGHAGSGDL